MATRAVLDNRINAAKNGHMLEQSSGRATGTWGNGYGQVLRGNGRPSDQAEDGPQLPANLKNDAWIDVYQSTAGFGWMMNVEADEAGVIYRRVITSHEGGPLVETAWVEIPAEVLP